MTYSTVSSHFLHIQRTALMYNGGMLIGMCIELVVRVHTACHVSCIALVILENSSNENVSPAYRLMRFTMLSRLMVL